MTRIRYKKVSKNIYQSTKKIHLGPYMAVININVLTNTLTVFDGITILYKSQEKDYFSARKKAKEVLKQMGAQFKEKPKKII